MSNNRTIDMEHLAEIFKALSNENRLRIVKRLMSCCTPGTVFHFEKKDAAAFVGELGEGLGIGKSTLSHHIKELKRVGVVKTQREGQRIKCWVDTETLQAIDQFFRE